MDACTKWAEHKGMKWERKKCNIICNSQVEVEDVDIRPKLSGGLIRKGLVAPYLGIAMTRSDVTDKFNLERGDQVMKEIYI